MRRSSVKVNVRPCPATTCGGLQPSFTSADLNYNLLQTGEPWKEEEDRLLAQYQVETVA